VFVPTTLRFGIRRKMMSNDMQYNTSATLLANVRADVNALMGGGDAEYQTASSGGASTSSNPAEGPLADVLKDLKEVLSKLIDALGGGGSTETIMPVSTSSADAISGEGRIWGDPHFIGADGGKYDVQGEAGKTYNLLSDQNFQMNGRFDAWGSGGATVVGEVGIAAGSDQIEVHKDGTVMVNGEELADGERVALADGGYVEKNGGNVELKSGEWEVDFQIQRDHINMDVRTDNAIADGVKPHGLLGQTFDGDGEARNGDKGRGAQGGGAIEGADGEMIAEGDRTSIEMYEVDGIHDRNFTEFNQFFDDAESNPSAYSAELQQLMAEAFGMMGQAMYALMQQGQTQNA
jgi:hypothetical protein